MTTQQQPTVFDLPKVLAVGIVSPAAAAITSRFGIGGTLLGLVLSSVFVTAGVDLLKVYLARVPGAVTTIPGGFRKKSSLRNFFERLKRPFSKVASLPRPRRRSLLKATLGAAALSCVVGLVLITLLEVGVGKSLSCWVWDDCSAAEASAAEGGTGSAQASTLPTILGGGQSTSSNDTPQAGSSSPQQQQPSGGGDSSSGDVQGTPSSQGTPGVSGAETPNGSSSAAQPGQRQGSSGPVKEDQQQSPSSSGPDGQQQPGSADDAAGGGGRGSAGGQ